MKIALFLPVSFCFSKVVPLEALEGQMQAQQANSISSN
jgi:hypothetical protein